MRNLSSTWLGDRTCFPTKDLGRLTDRVRDEGLHWLSSVTLQFWIFNCAPTGSPAEYLERQSVEGNQCAYTCGEPPSTTTPFRDVATVVRCEKHDGLRDLVGVPNLPSGTLLEMIFMCSSAASMECHGACS